MSGNQLSFWNGGKDLPPKYRIMRLPEVKAITGLSRSTIYFRIASRYVSETGQLGRTRSRLAGKRNPRMATTTNRSKSQSWRQQRFIELSARFTAIHEALS